MIGESKLFLEHNSLQSYKVPGRLKLSRQLLDNAYESVQASIRPLLATAARFGSTIASDGWNDAQIESESRVDGDLTMFRLMATSQCSIANA